MMALTPINLGSAPNDGRGDNLRTAGQTINDNFAAVEAALGTIPTGIEGAGARSFTNIDALLANTQTTYNSGSNQVVAGNIVRTLAEGFAYRVAASSASDHHVTTAGGVKLYVLPGPDGWNVKAFGAKGDNKTDDTAAFNAALTANPAWGGISQPYSLGRATIHIPRGSYLCNGTIQAQHNSAGLVLKGEGVRTTRIVRTNNSGTLFRFSLYSFVEISDMAILHDPGSTPRSGWSNKCFELNGTSGGQKFYLSRLRIDKFDRVISHEHFANEDTTYVTSCRFDDSKTVVYARNLQAVINKFTQCTWRGQIDRAFDVRGYGYTHIDTANVVMSGTFLYSAGGAGGTSNQFLLSNAKFEYSRWGTVKIVEIADNAESSTFVKMIGCGIAGGERDPAVFQFDLQGMHYTLHVDGGEFQGCRIRTRGRDFKDNLNQRFWVRFENLVASPSLAIERVGATGMQHPPVIIRNCSNRANITLTTPYGGGSDFRPTPGPHSPNWESISNPNGVVRSGTSTYSFPTFGQLVEVRSVRLLLGAKTTGTLSATMKVFTDAAKTVQVGSTVTITNTAPAAYEVSAPVGTFTSEGVYVEITRTGSANAHGRITCETVSV
jgi:hypothetical protein